MIGFVVFAMALAEGTAYDWLPVILVDEHGFSQGLGAMIFVLFAAMMTLGRFGGGWLLMRFGRLVVVRGSIVLVAAGVAFIVLDDHQVMAGIAVLCWGTGAALAFPLALSAAAEGDDRGADRVKAVATIGYIALLVGPPSLGFVGQQFGLRGARLLVLGLVVVALSLSHAMKPARPLNT